MGGLSDTQGVSPHRVDLIVRGRIGEGVANDANIKRGLLVEKLSNGKYQRHSTAGGFGEPIIALDDGLQGWPKDVDDAYASGDIFPLAHLVPGDEVYGRIPIGATVTINDWVASNGDGTVVTSTASAASLLYDSVAASTAVTATNVETLFDKNYTFPANFLQVGDVIRVRGQAIATATNSTDTLTLKLKIGSTVIIATAAVDVANGDIGYFDAEISIRTIGSGGTFVATGVQGLGVPATLTAYPFLLASTAIDTTVAKQLGISATWSTTNAGNSCRLDVFSVELARGLGPRLLMKAMETVNNSAGTAPAGIRLRYVG